MYSRQSLVLTCEHASARIPRRYRSFFPTRVLNTHRAFDRGAASLARRLGKTFGIVVAEGRVSRLLVDLNRSPHNPSLFSSYAKILGQEACDEIYERYYTRYRERLLSDVGDRIRRRQSVLHLSVHTFAARLRGKPRRADIGLLYDPSRKGEADLCRSWRREIEAVDAGLRVRFNYPYRGVSDGLTTYLRRRYSGSVYAGIELEVNQKFLSGAARRWVELQEMLSETLRRVLAHKKGHPLLNSR